MSEQQIVKVPDIGDVSEVDVIEVLVAPGDEIKVDDSLIVLETDKATMEVPSSHAGKVESLLVKVGDKVSQGDPILSLVAAEGESSTDSTSKDSQTEVSEDAASAPEKQQEATSIEPLEVPDIGDVSDVDVIEVLIQPGDQISKDQGLIVLETDKATMEVPSPVAGEIKDVKVKVGDKVSQGSLIGHILTEPQGAEKSSASPEPKITEEKPLAPSLMAPTPTKKKAPVPDHPALQKRPVEGKLIHASPAVRRFARELGADLSKVTGTGPKGRILKEDVQNFIKFELSRPKATASTGAFAMPEMPEIDHAKWGSIETQSLTRIQKISSVNLHRNWVTIPHVTQHEDADITELEAFRKSLKDEAAKEGIRLTPLAFVMKAVVHSLKAFPKFNASLANDGESLILKRYYHIGVAVDTPDGLTVPVIRDVDKKSVYELAAELAEVSSKAREKKLSAEDMQGSSFTISSLGGIGGTAFTPIVKWPDVAILGLSRNKMQPVWNGQSFEPRLMLPMSLSYDHRVIDGADAARFCVHLAQTLADIRRVLLK